MAEGLFRDILQKNGKTGINVSSAGCLAGDGRPATAETIQVMAEEGIDVSKHRSRYLTEEMIKDADLILVMESLHRSEIRQRAPGAAGKTYLLKEYAASGNKESRDNQDVPDPIGRPLDIYRICLKMIKKEVEAIAKLL